MIEAGDLSATLIDGNHTHATLRDLHDILPEVECFKARYS